MAGSWNDNLDNGGQEEGQKACAKGRLTLSPHWKLCLLLHWGEISTAKRKEGSWGDEGNLGYSGVAIECGQDDKGDLVGVGIGVFIAWGETCMIGKEGNQKIKHVPRATQR